MFTSAVAALQAMANCRSPVSTPHPSSMTPLQLSSMALKHSSGPVGVHACTSVVPGGGARFVACTLLEGGFADAEGRQERRTANAQSTTPRAPGAAARAGARAG